MANSYYNENFQGRAGQTARADHVKIELKGIDTAFEQVEEVLKRTVRGAQGETMNNLPAAAARAGRYLRFNAQGQPEAVQTGFTWRGPYSAGAVYQVGDVVIYGPYGSLYICIVAHTAGTTLNTGNFQIMIDLTGLNVIKNQIRTASFVAAPAGDYLVDSSAGNIQITLPAIASITDAPINITHIGGSLVGSQQITIARNGHLIMGLAEDLMVDKQNASISLMYADAARGYRLRVTA